MNPDEFVHIIPLNSFLLSCSTEHTCCALTLLTGLSKWTHIGAESTVVVVNLCVDTESATQLFSEVGTRGVCCISKVCQISNISEISHIISEVCWSVEHCIVEYTWCSVVFCM